MKTELVERKIRKLHLLNKQKFLVFDVESVGINGHAFAWGACVTVGGHIIDSAHGAMELKFDWRDDPDDVDWVRENIPYLQPNCDGEYELYESAVEFFKKHNDALFAAECPYPVEHNFLNTAKKLIQEFKQPYPILDITTTMMAAGMDAMSTFPRHKSELPKHDPLRDAFQSARLLHEALLALNGKN